MSESQSQSVLNEGELFTPPAEIGAIPYDFNPMGTQKVELPYEAPLLELDPQSPWAHRNGMPSDLRPYTFKMWSKAFGSQETISYQYFDGDYTTYSRIYGTKSFRLIFEYPVKIIGFTFYVGGNYGYVTLYRVDEEGNRIQIAKPPRMNANTVVSVRADNEVFCTEYVFELYGPNTWFGIREIDLNAYYRPSDLQPLS